MRFTLTLIPDLVERGNILPILVLEERPPQDPPDLLGQVHIFRLANWLPLLLILMILQNHQGQEMLRLVKYLAEATGGM